MTLERAIRLAQRWAFGGVCTLREGEAQEYHKMALAALRAQQEREDPKPLTLDELRQMDGEPVWIVEGPEDWGHWELSSDAEDYLEDRDADFYSMRYNDPAGRYGLHKLGWLAYRHKPKEEPHE